MLNDRVVQWARSLKVTRGRKLRLDTNAVQTNIPYPTDSALIGDGVRVLAVTSSVRGSRGGPTRCGVITG